MAETNAATSGTAHDDDEEDFNTGDARASATYPQQCSALRKNGYAMLKNRPCKIMEMSTSKTGKHRHAKLLDIDNDRYVSLMDDSSDTRSDIKLPEGDLCHEIKAKFEIGDGVKVTVLKAFGEEAIMSYKLEQDSRK